jgi:transposase
MINDICLERVYLACGSTDLRKSIDGLAVLVKEGFQLDPFSSCLFVFCNRKRDKLKILHWEHNGFWRVHHGCYLAQVARLRERLGVFPTGYGSM